MGERFRRIFCNTVKNSTTSLYFSGTYLRKDDGSAARGRGESKCVVAERMQIAKLFLETLDFTDWMRIADAWIVGVCCVATIVLALSLKEFEFKKKSHGTATYFT
jgi:hypothetical protein